MAFFEMSEGVFDLNPTAIKTGTAQIKIAGKTQYTYIGWFVAFAPIKNPQITFV